VAVGWLIAAPLAFRWLDLPPPELLAHTFLNLLLTWAHGDEAGCRSYAERYRARAAECGFAGHVAQAEAM
jgi:hypothetical protein